MCRTAEPLILLGTGVCVLFVMQHLATLLMYISFQHRNFVKFFFCTESTSLYHLLQLKNMCMGGGGVQGVGPYIFCLFRINLVDTAALHADKTFAWVQFITNAIVLSISTLSAMTSSGMDADGIFDFPSPVNHLLSRLAKVTTSPVIEFRHSIHLFVRISSLVHSALYYIN